MHLELFDVLRCPYCGGRLNLVASMFHVKNGDWIDEGIIGCHCCIFPVVDGIPVLHLQPAAIAARQHVEEGRPRLALRAMVGLESDREAEAFEAVARAETSTYREIVDALGPNFEGGYFLYRFSDPTYVVAQAVVRSVARTVLAGKRRAVDVCGGSGHLTRALVNLSAPPPVLADLYFAKMWLARRFTAPSCEPVCCDGNSPLPFARGVFGYAMCSDAFQYIWTKRQFVGELTRLVAAGREPGAVVINHTHNQLAWSPSHGQPLSPAGYRDLYEDIEPRVFAEAHLLADVIGGGPLDLSRRDPDDVLNADPALTIIASEHPGVFSRHPLEPPTKAQGEFRVNPLYGAEVRDGLLHLRLRFPSPDYEDEYGACRQYLPDETTVPQEALRALQAGGAPGELADLLRRRVIVDLPKRYY
jgi:uncharacterized protein YbaR (Trm112 family)